jgi:uncharacterized protein
VAWHGGEPTLMGVDFYHKAIVYQEKYRNPGMQPIQSMGFENTMQTNGILLGALAVELIITVLVQLGIISLSAH